MRKESISQMLHTDHLPEMYLNLFKKHLRETEKGNEKMHFNCCKLANSFLILVLLVL